MNRSSISLIKEKLNKPLYVVINKVDTKPKSEVDKVEALISKTLKDAGLKVEKYIRFSAKAPLEDIMAPIKSVGSTSENDTFVEDVQTDLEGLSKNTKVQFKMLLANMTDMQKLTVSRLEKWKGALKLYLIIVVMPQIFHTGKLIRFLKTDLKCLETKANNL